MNIFPRRRLLEIGAGVATGLVVVPGARVKAEVEAPLLPLFNGRDLAGWVPVNVAPSTFSARDGLVVCTGVPTGIMRTERQYENFILELEWRHMKPGGNAGLFVHSEPITAPGVPFSKSIEIQIIDGDSPEGVWTGHGDVFSIHGARMVPDRPHPRGWERCLPSERRARPAGEWNHYRVESREGRITLAVNGKVVSGASQCRPRKGYICLESEGSECHFRNLRLQELPSSAPPAAETAGVDVGFKSLYSGVDLAGWNVGAGGLEHWRPRDWVLACDGQGPGELATEQEWGEVELIVDWRLPAGGEAALAPRGRAGAAVVLKAAGDRWQRSHLTLRGATLEVRHGDAVAQAIGSGASRGPLILRHLGKPVEFANLYARPLA